MENREMIRENMKDLIYRELDAIANEGQLAYDCLQVVGDLVDILKDFGEIEEGEMMASNDGYSRDGGYSMRGGRMPRYYDGNSYGNGAYYNRNGGRGNGYNRDDGKRDMISKLENLWNEARDDHDKEAIKRLIDQMK